jgi:tetratricopeptide (TPR) repeat protein
MFADHCAKVSGDAQLLSIMPKNKMNQPNLWHSHLIKFVPRCSRPIAVYLATAVMVALFGAMSQGRVQDEPARPGTATLTGHVTDAQGHSIAGVHVKISSQDNEVIRQSQTDAQGNYRIVSIPKGTYTLGAALERYDDASSGPFTLGTEETKAIDLILRDKSFQQPGSPRAPEFFDEPKFTIAGVTDTTNLGGHASGMTGPTESLAKDVVAAAPSPSAPAPNGTAEQAARNLADRNTSDFRANHSAGKLLLDDGKPRDAVPYLARALKLNPNDYGNSYELARAYAGAAEYDEARNLIKTMLTERKSADLHYLLATVEEKSGNPVQAQAEFQEAAKLDPSETNLFDWGMELLTHHATEPAIEVFKNGNRRFPQSARMLSGLAAAFYERGAYDEALQNACAAADISLRDANPYLLLGKMQNADRGQSDAPLSRLERFARLQPENPWANYYYALALWKRRKGPQDVSTSAHVESLLQKAVHLDPRLANAYFQLGVVYAEKNNLPQAIALYENAVRIDPQLPEAHYRLAQAYVASGQTDKSQREIALYKQNAKARADAADRERREVQQFVYTMQGRPAAETNQ